MKKENPQKRKSAKSGKGKINKVLFAVAAILIIVGLIIGVYPQITNAVYDKTVSAEELEFEQKTEQSDFDALYTLLRQKNEQLYQNSQADLKDPFSYSQPDIDLSQYGIENDIIGYVSIPRLDVTMPIILGANDSNLKKGAVHLTQTSYPIGGENTNAVIAAHRGWSKSKMLRHIEKLETGDEIYIRNFRETLVYRVSKIAIIEPTEIDKLMIRPGEDMITLITCHPYRVNTQRYVVYCTRAAE